MKEYRDDKMDEDTKRVSPLRRIKNSSFRRMSTLKRADQGLSTIDQSSIQESDHILSKENKFIRFKINDLLAHTHVQMILVKIWKILLDLQSPNSSITVHNCVTFSIDLSRKYQDYLNLYESFLPLLKRGYGCYYDNDYYKSLICVFIH